MRKIFRLKSTTARLKFKEIDRDQKKQWNVMINSTVHEKFLPSKKLLNYKS